jgi:hypothetical protein
MASYYQNLETTANPVQQQVSNPALLNEGYPGISSPQSQTSFQPTSDTGTMSSSTSPASMLNGLSKDVLLGTITNLPQQDVATFFSGLPQNEQTQIQTYIQQNPNAQGQDLYTQLSQLPTADLAQGLAMVPGTDLQQAIAAAKQAGGGAAGVDATTGTTGSTTGTGTDASLGQTTQPAYSPDGSIASPQTQSAGSDASGLYTQPGSTSGLYTQPGAVSDGSGLSTQQQQPAGGDTSGLYTQQSPAGTDANGQYTQTTPAGTDSSGLATQPGANGQTAPMDATAGGTAQQGTGDNSAVLNKLATLNAAELGSVISRLPQQDLAAFFKALPSSDQQSLQSDLGNNNNPSAQDIATAMSKLPTRDVLAAAGAVPASDFASLLSTDSSSSATNQAPKPGGSEFPLLFGLGATAGAGYLAYRKGAFEKVPDLFQKLTGRFDVQAPSWMTKFGKGGADAAEVSVAPVTADTSVVSTMAGDGVSLGTQIAEGSADLLKAGTEVGSVASAVEHAGVAAKVIQDGLDVAEVVH